MEARVGIEPTHKGFADLSLTTWVPRHLLLKPSPEPANFGRRNDRVVWSMCQSIERKFGAGDRGRTGDIFLGKEALYH
jgi:hypothetical protein